MIVDQKALLDIAVKYLDGKELTCDEVEILLFALYIESVTRGDGLMMKALAELVIVRKK